MGVADISLRTAREVRAEWCVESASRVPGHSRSGALNRAERGDYRDYEVEINKMSVIRISGPQDIAYKIVKD